MLPIQNYICSIFSPIYIQHFHQDNIDIIITENVFHYLLFSILQHWILELLNIIFQHFKDLTEDNEYQDHYNRTGNNCILKILIETVKTLQLEMTIINLHTVLL